MTKNGWFQKAVQNLRATQATHSIMLREMFEQQAAECMVEWYLTSE